MTIPTEPIGSVPRPEELIAAMTAAAAGSIPRAELDALFDEAVRDTVARMEATGAPVVTDGEQRKPSFVTYPVNMHPGQRIFVGVTDPIDPRIETAEEVRDRVLLAARYIPLDVLGTTDDCGFSPFAVDPSTARETAFEKIRVRVEGTALAERELAA